MTIAFTIVSIFLLILGYFYIELKSDYEDIKEENHKYFFDELERDLNKDRNIKVDNEAAMIREAKIANLKKENEDLKAEIGKILLEKHDRRNKSKS